MDYMKCAMDSSSISRSGRGEESGANTEIEIISSSSNSSTSPARQPPPFQSKSSSKEYNIIDKILPFVELFIGDLSFFCNERNLIDLFSPFGKILQTTICRCNNGGHSLLHGFMKMSNTEEAEMAAAKLNDSPFMGRSLRVQVCSLEGARLVRPPRPGYHVHVSFAADPKIPNITEEKLRGTFDQFGAISDVIVKRHSRMKDPPRQKGYGFVYFHSQEHAEWAVSALNGKIIDDITFECAVSRKKESEVVMDVGVAHTQTQDGNNGSASSRKITSSLKSANEQDCHSVPAIKPTTHGHGSHSYASVQQVPSRVANQDYGMHQRGPHGHYVQMPVFSPPVVYFWGPPPPPPPFHPTAAFYSYDSSSSQHHAQHCTMNEMQDTNRIESMNCQVTSASSVMESAVKDTYSQHVGVSNSSGAWFSTNSTQGVSAGVGMPLFPCGYTATYSNPIVPLPADGRQNMAQQQLPKQYYGVNDCSTVLITNPIQRYGPPPQLLTSKSTKPSVIATSSTSSNPNVIQQDYHVMSYCPPYPLPQQQNNFMQPRIQTYQYYPHN